MEPPILVGLEGPVVVDQAEISQRVDLAFAALDDDVPEEVPPLHRGVWLADLRSPKAQPHVGVGVLQVRLNAATPEGLDELRRVKTAQQGWIPVGNMNIHRRATVHFVGPFGESRRGGGYRRGRPDGEGLLYQHACSGGRDNRTEKGPSIHNLTSP